MNYVFLIIFSFHQRFDDNKIHFCLFYELLYIAYQLNYYYFYEYNCYLYENFQYYFITVYLL